MSGIDVKTAQHRLGHSSPVLTLAVYASRSMDARRALEQPDDAGPARP